MDVLRVDCAFGRQRPPTARPQANQTFRTTPTLIASPACAVGSRLQQRRHCVLIKVRGFEEERRANLPGSLRV